MTDENNVVPASGKRAALLGQMLTYAKDLPEIIELERSGVRDGNGYWQGSDAFGGTVENLTKAWQELRDAPTQHKPSDDICPGCGVHMQFTHHPFCKGPDDPKPSPSNDLGTLVWIPHDGPVEVIQKVEPRTRSFQFWQGSADEGWTKIRYGFGGILDDELPF